MKENVYKNLRKKRGLTQVELAKELNMRQSSVSRWENGESIPDFTTLTLLSKYFNVSTDYLLGRTDNISQKMPTIPVLGVIPAGIPIEAVEDIEDYIDINPKFSDTSEYFALKVKGDSMTPRILNGDVIIVKKQENAENGDICVVMVNGDDATVKKIKKEDSGLWLIPINPAHPTTFFSNQEIIEKPVRILGKAIEIRSSL